MPVIRDVRHFFFRALCLSLYSKQRKMRFIYLILCAAAVCSCGLVEIGGTSGDRQHNVWIAPGTGNLENNGKTRCYITGFDYPDGYDWRADAQAGSVKCSLVVFADMVPVMKVPVGDSYETGWEPDMHRIIDGHLYTDWCSGKETVIKKDGRLLFRYEGREMICGMVPDGDDIYSLGQYRSGSGFCFRKNGEPIFRKETGYVIGNLQHTSAGIGFAYCEEIVSDKGGICRYYYFLDGNVTQVAVREDVKKIWDVILYGGELCYIADLVGINMPVTVCGEKMSAIALTGSASMLACRFVPVSGKVFVEGVFTADGHTLQSGLWVDGVLYRMSDPGYTVSSLCAWQNDLCCLLNSAAAGAVARISRFGDISDVPDGYVPAGCSPLAVVDGILYVGLSSVTGGKPVIWKDGSVQELDMNGYISSIYAAGANPPTKGCATYPGLR